jgi:hypothetical protein
MINWIVASVLIGFIGYVAYQVGYLRGYGAGLAYGMEKLKEFHEYVRTGLQTSDPEQEMRKVIIEYHTKDGDE